MEGRLKRANSKGYGFIETDKKIDFFFHASEFDGNWLELLSYYVQGKTVAMKFDVDPTTSKQGPRALKVSIVQVIE